MTTRLIVGIGLAAACWAAMFLLDRRRFWTRALAGGTVIGAYAVAVDHRGIGRLLAHGRWPAEAAAGVGAAAVLYGVFWIGDQLLALLLPGLARQVGDLYLVRGETRPRRIPLVLLVVGPAEELFWRGFVQHRAGVAVALACYGAVHLWERKPVLVLAALAGGAFWGGLLGLTGSLVAPIACHALWDLAVIVWWPIHPLPAIVRRRSQP